MAPVRIAVDAMGGDKAPGEIVRGAMVAASKLSDVELVLVGRREAIERELAGETSGIEILHCDQVIEMEESPTDAFRKKPDSSIARSVGLVKSGDCQAAISAGNTGAMVASSMLVLRQLEGVLRAGICVAFPTPAGPCTIVDVGANTACKPAHLLQYGIMASVFAENVLSIENPSVGLLNIGGEASKGNELVRQTHELLSESSLNFVGNVEGDEIHGGRIKVIVCEGFVGNVLLKTVEGLSETLLATMAEELEKVMGDRVAACRQALRGLAEKRDYAAYGGAPLLGVDGVSIISHGRSNARAISNAIREAFEMVGHHVNEKIVEAIALNEVRAPAS